MITTAPCPRARTGKVCAQKTLVRQVPAGMVTAMPVRQPSPMRGSRPRPACARTLLCALLIALFGGFGLGIDAPRDGEPLPHITRGAALHAKGVRNGRATLEAPREAWVFIAPGAGGDEPVAIIEPVQTLLAGVPVMVLAAWRAAAEPPRAALAFNARAPPANIRP